MIDQSFGYSPSVADEIAGTIGLKVARHGKRTGPVVAECSGVMRLLRPLYLDDSGQTTYIIVNPGGGYFGEKYKHVIDVLPDAHLLVTSQGATRIYRTPKDPAEQHLHITLGEGARLEYMPDQTIAYKDADYRQYTTITAAPTAQCFVGEIITPGWDPEGINFTYSGVRLRLEVRSSEQPGLVCVDNVHVRPEELRDAISEMGYFEGFTHMGSVLVIGQHTTSADYTDTVREIVDAMPLGQVGVTTGSRHGMSWLMVRALANSTDDLNNMTLSVNAYDRSITTGQKRLDLRRY